MDITPTTTTSTKSPEADTETPTRIPAPAKPISFTNGVLKRHHSHHLAGAPVVVTYKECLKNHAAALGGHALDGCGEFMPSPAATAADPTSLKCAACGCHRNFHRRDPDEPPPPPQIPTTHVIEYQPHHRHHPPPPVAQPLHGGGIRSPNSASPPPISSSYYPSAPHMLLALSAGAVAGGQIVSPASNPSSRKRFRTKFTQTQKEKMYEFAERVGWKMQKRDDELTHEFCSEIGVDRGVLKVWMHNNKNTLGKRDVNGNGIAAADDNNGNGNGNGGDGHQHQGATTNGSSSSS